MEEQQPNLLFQLISENFWVILIFIALFLIALVVVVFMLVTKQSMTVEIGGNKVKFGGRQAINIDTLIEIRHQKTMAEAKCHREIISEQKEHVQIRQTKLKNLLRCCTDEPKESLIKAVTLEWMMIFFQIAERNAIEDKFDGDTVKSDYSKNKIDQLMEVYKESHALSWSGFAPPESIKEGLTEIFEDLLLELRQIAREKRAELDETLAGYEKILSGISGKEENGE
jgi:LPS O-antigen subunit length determinant protein (WzzB/FepE family)